MAIDTSQLPDGAQKSIGNTKQPAGVIEEGFIPDGDVLLRQAEMFAAQRGIGASYQAGADMSGDVIERVAKHTYPGISGMNAETINALQQGTLERDGVFVGNNANFTGYYLEPGAKFVIPQMTPVRNMTPRVKGMGIDTINWRVVLDYFGGTGPTVAGAAIQQQGTPSALSYQWSSLSNVFKMLAYRDSVTFESEIYGRMWQGDVRATIAAKLIPAIMQEEEMWLINSGQKLWPPAPAYNLATATTGGTIAAATNWILITAVNANGETLAYSATAQSIVTTGATSTVSLNIPTVPSATKYNVYVGTGATQPATSAMWLQSATTQFGGASALNQPTNVLKQGYITVTATAAWATSGTAYSTLTSNTAIVVKSTDANTLNLPLTFDGIQALIFNNFGAGGSLGILGETPLVVQPAAANGSLALSDVDGLLENMALSAHADPEYVFVGIKDHRKLSNLVAQGTNFRVTQQMGTGMAELMGGQRVTKYINQTTGKLMDVIMLPYLGQGTIIVGSYSIPFPVSAIDKPPFRVEVNQEMWAVEYPPDQSHFNQWGYAAFLNETLVNQYMGGWGVINGISTQ